VRSIKTKHGLGFLQVTLVIPWLAAPDQHMVFPGNTVFDTPEQQEEFVRGWVRKRTGLPCNFKIKFYPGHYAAEKCSILPVGDPTQYIPDSEVTLKFNSTRLRCCLRHAEEYGGSLVIVEASDALHCLAH
jgi:hypothetical protein